MSRATNIVLTGWIAALLPACAEDLPMDPSYRSEGLMGAGVPPVPFIGGSWEFEETVWVLQPSELNPVIGAPPSETPMTQVVCESTGTFEIDQDGATFDGTATQSVVCHVDGVAFVPPEFAFNPDFTIDQGILRGRSIWFETGHSLNICDNRGSIRVEEGVAVEIKAVGDCPVPFSPGEQHARWTLRRPE